jgi:hypothetical protein
LNINKIKTKCLFSTYDFSINRCTMEGCHTMRVIFAYLYKQKKENHWYEMNYASDIYFIFISHCTFSEWRFHVGSFCLVRNEGLDGVPPEKCTRDRYWKARIVEIWRPWRSRRKKSNGTCTPVSGENFHQVLPHLILFQEHYLLVQWFYSTDDIKEVMPRDIEGLDR